jgi:excisionase family DNA binding protein
MEYSIEEAKSMENLLTIEETAAKLKMHPETVRQWLRDGKLAGVKLSRDWRVRESDLAAFINARLVPAKAGIHE